MQLYQLYFYVPESHLEVVKTAVFTAGAGQIGNYDCCAWQVMGQGQYRPLPGSKPYHGERQELTTITEYRVETVCLAENLTAVIAALHKTHPYETPAYGVIKLETI